MSVATLMQLLFGMTADKVYLSPAPMYHAAPLRFMMSSLSIGATVVVMPKFEPELFLTYIEQYRATHTQVVPTMFVRMLKLPEAERLRFDVSSLQTVIHAAAPCPVETKRAMIEWWGPKIHEYYAGTEGNGFVACNSEEWLAHPGTVGKPIPEAEVRVIDKDGRDAPQGEVGEVVARNRFINDFTYHGDDQKRRDSERAGLIAPGDIGYFDKDGFLYLCDRAKDMIISGGVNIYPAEIEAELLKMPGVADCAVFGIPDEEFGEGVCAVVQPAEGADLSEASVKAYLRDHVAGYKIPRRVELAADLPREDSGKIFKRKLREPFWEGLERRI